MELMGVARAWRARGAAAEAWSSRAMAAATQQQQQLASRRSGLKRARCVTSYDYDYDKDVLINIARCGTEESNAAGAVDASGEGGGAGNNNNNNNNGLRQKDKQKQKQKQQTVSGGDGAHGTARRTYESSRSISLQCSSCSRGVARAGLNAEDSGADPIIDSRDGRRRGVAYVEVGGDENRIMSTVSIVSRSSSSGSQQRNRIVATSNNANILRVSITYTRFARGLNTDGTSKGSHTSERHRSTDEYEMACRVQDALSSAVFTERIACGMAVDVDILILRSGEG